MRAAILALRCLRDSEIDLDLAPAISDDTATAAATDIAPETAPAIFKRGRGGAKARTKAFGRKQ